MASSRGPLSPIGNTPPFLGLSADDGSPSPAKPGSLISRMGRRPLMRMSDLDQPRPQNEIAGAVDQPFTQSLPLKLPPPARLASEAKPGATRWFATAGQSAVLQEESGEQRGGQLSAPGASVLRPAARLG